MKYLIIIPTILLLIIISLLIVDSMIGISTKITYPAIINDKVFEIDTIADDTIQLYPGPTTISIGGGLHYDYLTSDIEVEHIYVELYIPYLKENIKWNITEDAFYNIQIGDTVNVTLGYTDFLGIRKQLMLRY